MVTTPLGSGASGSSDADRLSLANRAPSPLVEPQPVPTSHRRRFPVAGGSERRRLRHLRQDTPPMSSTPPSRMLPAIALRHLLNLPRGTSGTHLPRDIPQPRGILRPQSDAGLAPAGFNRSYRVDRSPDGTDEAQPAPQLWRTAKVSGPSRQRQYFIRRHARDVGLRIPNRMSKLVMTLGKASQSSSRVGSTFAGPRRRQRSFQGAIQERPGLAGCLGRWLRPYERRDGRCVTRRAAAQRRLATPRESSAPSQRGW